MSNGLTEGSRVEQEWNALYDALSKLDEFLDNVYDYVFGLPVGVKEEIEIILNKYKLKLSKD